ncbi:GNAT family N-acetyltransferase [Paenibacillus montanisoli]|uniref:GNAT family N-acetyltransferase n=1 Tax=Paenibacillus montanisoli TaxID=2081970 RepID=A0A328U9G9_9BACL|nr:GNAT family N-acetyltransferase [Paenibacillus montanisoli]RAP77991.1 GNAT family N-acetyltransferase [Paenibacillus montanisoli]
MLTLIRSSHALLASELAILNSNPYFNSISKDKEQLTEADLAAEQKDAEQAGAERYIIRDDGKDIGILEFLMTNPNDSCTWIGLLVINGNYQGRGYGNAALILFDAMMRERGVKSYRLGVLAANEPAHAFWQRNGCTPVKPAVLPDGKDIIIYERTVR